jgi:hypothetical protein
MMNRIYKLSVFLLGIFITHSISAQDISQGVPITFKVEGSKNLLEGSVTLTGTTISLNEEPGLLNIEVTKPDNSIDKLQARADKVTGIFSIKYFPKAVGQYQAKAISPDKLNTAEVEFEVELDWESDKDLDEYVELLNETSVLLDEAVKSLNNTGVQNSEDNNTTTEKVNKTREKISAYTESIKNIKAGLSDFNKLVAKYPEIKKYSSTEIGKLSSTIDEQIDELKNVKEIMGIKNPKGLNYCDLCYQIGEGCAAFSTCMNFGSKSLTTIIDNIYTDKVWPSIQDNFIKPKTFNDNDNFLFAQAGKAFLTAKTGIANLKTPDYGFGLASDLTQYIVLDLKKKYCTEFKGPLNGDYTLEFKQNGARYMYYKLQFKGKISLYCLKSQGNKNESQWDGFIEANVVKVDFTDNVWAVEDKSKWEEKYYKRIPMIVSPYEYSEKDPGFGAIARGALPGAFYFPIKGKMVNGKMVIQLLDARIDLNQLNSNKTVMIVAQPNNPLSVRGIVFDYPITTAQFILTRAMRMPEKNPIVTLDIVKENEVNKIKGKFTRTETPTDIKVDFNLNFEMEQK